MHKLPFYFGFFLCLSSARATEVHNTNDSGSGSLRAAISNTPADGQVTFHPSMSGETITLTSGELVLNKNLTIDASELSEGLTIDANANSRVFSVNLNTTCNLVSLYLRNGRASGSFPGNLGGGILNQGTLTLQNTTLASCEASGNGGGIYNNAGNLSLIHSTVAQNEADLGGGIYTVGGSTTLLSSTLSANTATNTGGGVYRLGTQGTATLTDSIVAGNTAPSTENFSGTIDTSSGNFLSGDPMLAPLGIYGGSIPTMHPLPGSPVIDGGGTSSIFSSDQRGYPRKSGARVDTGAVEVAPTHVLNTDDDGRGSLREVVEHSFPGNRIFFVSSLSGQTIRLTSGAIQVERDLDLYALPLPEGITIDGNASSEIFHIRRNSTSTLTSLTLTNGKGAILNSGILTIRESTITSCTGTAGGGIHNEFGAELSLLDSTIELCSSTSNGGGIFNRGIVTLERSTIHSCSATPFANGGGIFSGGLFSNQTASLTIINSTVAQNDATRDGGGIFIGSHSSLTLTNSTVTGNTAASDGGGLYRHVDAISLNARESIIANNSAPTDPNSSGSFNTNFANFTTGDPMLAPLGNYGGPTPTMRPLPGSPVIDAGPTSSTYTDDQRGYARQHGTAVDIGAVEYQPAIVTNTNDNGAGSLRQVVDDAHYGDVITFANALSGETITFTSGQISVQENLSIDASSLAEGITIDGNENSRIFEFTSGSTNTLAGLTLTNGMVSGANSGGYGGAIHVTNGGTLAVHNSTIFGNSANRGGAVYSAGDLEMSNCTLTGNASSSVWGGGIYSIGSLDLNHLTISGNSVGSNGNQRGGRGLSLKRTATKNLQFDHHGKCPG